jgi:RNA polymerase sigma-70 factor (subfamily 1)
VTIGKAGRGADDADLVARATGGDADALAALLAQFGPAVRHRLVGRIGQAWRSVLDEDDVMQVTYLEAFLRIRSFRPRGEAGASFQAWLAQVAENNLRDAVRGLERAKRPDPRRRVTGGVSQESYVSLVEMLGMTSTTPSRQAAGHEAADAIEAALAQLPADYRTVIRMYDLEGRDIEEVGRALKRSSGAVYMLRARAHDRLREVLGSASKFFSRPA